MDTLHIGVLDEISGQGDHFKRICAEMKGFKGDKIVLPINSYGGSVLEGFSIYNALVAHPSNIETQIVGYAISMGTIIALAGDEVKMPENSIFMIHEPWNFAMGDADDMASEANLLNKLADQLAEIYSKKTGIEKAEIRQMMKDETWLNAKEAKKLGFVDTITKGAEIHAKLDATKYKNIPESILSATGSKNGQISPNQTNNTKENKEEMLDAIKAYFSKEDKKAEDMTAADVGEVIANNLKPTIESSVKSEVENQFKTLQASITKSQSEIENLAGKIENLASKEDVESKVSASETKVTEELQSKVDELKAANKTLSDTLAEVSGKSVPGGSGAPDTSFASGASQATYVDLSTFSLKGEKK